MVKPMRKVEGLNYHQWQKRNTNCFKSLPKLQQREARERGYHNVGWNKVQESWHILVELTLSSSPSLEQDNKVLSLFEHKVNQEDLLGAINLSILEAEQAKKTAQQSLETLNKHQEKFEKLADKALEKYNIL